jgi:peptidoglycan/xylan/chitin deacetylase (PgdA/CDA1 family)
MLIALKIDVDTLRGTLEGAPALAHLLARRGIDATFLFSLGPDNTGRALRRLFRPGFLGKALRTSVAQNYGLGTLSYGVLRPGPDIGKRGAAAMQGVRDAGFEVGIHAWDHVRWQDNVGRKDRAWTLAEMQRAAERFVDIFGAPAQTFGAAGWQVNQHALAIEAEHGYTYCSDTRGHCPFRPAMAGQRFSCPQLPTTLPTLDELVGLDGRTIESAIGVLATAADKAVPSGHVFTLHAELEGMAYLSQFEKLLDLWLAAGHTLGSLRELYNTLESAALPVHEVIAGSVPGRSGHLALQGPRL